MSESLLTQAQTAAGQFLEGRTVASVRPFGDGHINDTFIVAAAPPEQKVVLQRINQNVFRRPAEVMENAVRVTRHIRQKIEAQQDGVRRETLRYLTAPDGSCCWTDPAGNYWRAYHYIDHVVSYSIVTDANALYVSGRAFGEFMQQLADFPAETLHETILQFHDTPNRYRNFHRALQADPLGRAKEVEAEIAFALAREPFAHRLVDALAQGALPLRCTHNDTKLNNILLDEKTGQAVCVIDLDTVMPGLAAYDFGDSIRFGANPAAEDERDLSKVNFSVEYYEAYRKGYLETAGAALTPAELDSLLVGAKMMTLECGVRFLTDYLEGDTYFKTHRPGQNLDRTRTQFKLIADMEALWPGELV